MDVEERCQPFLNLADDLLLLRLTGGQLSSRILQLPSLDRTTLNQLGRRVEKAVEPRRGCAIARVTYIAANTQKLDLFSRSLAAWYLGRAFNSWGQPRRAAAVLRRARWGFVSLNEVSWVAACDWQLNELPWTKPDFPQACNELEQALDALERAGCAEFIPRCRLALAYAQILTGECEKAHQNILTSEGDFAAAGDSLNRARCWLHEASRLRRQSCFDEAVDKLQQAMTVFEAESVLVDVAKVHYQIALACMLKSDRLDDAEAHSRRGARLFSSLGMNLWRAMCLHNLGSVLLLKGELKRSEKCYRQARKIFTRHGILGLIADNLNDNGQLNILRGRPDISIAQFKECEAINERLGSQMPAAVAIANLGEAYGQFGRYQDALYHLERAAERLQSLGNYSRLATCEKYMARIWSQLGQPAAALDHLDKAFDYYEMSGQKAFLPAVYNQRAGIFFQLGKDAEALGALEKSLSIAEVYGVRPQAALARRFLGEALHRTARNQEALICLQKALSEAREMGMQDEQAACLIAIANCLETASEIAAARLAYEDALRLSDGASPEIDWRAYVGLGRLAETQSDLSLAIHLYRQGLDIFTHIRQNFWQPALAGSYLQAPACLFDHMISAAARAGAAEDTLLFIEQGKASTFLRQLIAHQTFSQDARSQDLLDLAAEMEELQDRLRTSLDHRVSFLVDSESRRTRAHLAEKVKQYDALKSRLERQRLSGQAAVIPHSGFSLPLFRQLAARMLGERWVALDFYITETQLVVLLVTPDECRVHCSTLTQRLKMALDACDLARRSAAPPTPGDLAVLGAALIPSSLSGLLDPRCHLLIAPHRQLHNLPWPALQPAFTRLPLVSVCLPVVVPSLHSLALLWERARPENLPPRDRGLLVGISDFDGLHEPLPSVKAEIAAISEKLRPGSRALLEKEATWENLLALKTGALPAGDPKDLSRFSWLHIASHVLTDRQTGRLSGVALAGGDIWLDRLRDLAPLPALVTLSACNGSDNFLYEGDERFDLQTVCFIAGANSVAGSIWPVQDQSAAALMTLFYDYYLAGFSPAEAAAKAQRQIIAGGGSHKDWASFLCAGAP